jgi:hypothetical protein
VIRTRSKDHPGEGWNLGKNPRWWYSLTSHESVRSNE